MVNSGAVTAYLGASAHSAMILGLGPDAYRIGDDALRAITSAMPLIDGLPGITGIGYSGHIETGTEVSSAGVPNLSQNTNYIG